MANWQVAFPKTIETLSRLGFASLVESFEFELQFQQLRLDLRWFPVFLKMQNCPARLQELAEFEYLRAHVYSAEMGAPKVDPGLLALNPGAQFLEVNQGLPELNREKGLYCFIKEGSRFFEMQLSLAQALLLDLLKEDRKFSVDQLLEQAELHQVKLNLNREEWRRVLASLEERAIIVRGPDRLAEV